MAIASIKIVPFRYANFVHLDIDKKIPGQTEADVALDVGKAFPNDDAAAEFWDELKAGWIKHVKERRSQLGKWEQP